MRIKTRRIDGVIVLKVTGKMTGEDLEEREQLRSLFLMKITELLEKNENNIVVDLSKVDEIDCYGLGYLVASFVKTMNEGQMKLVLADGTVRSILSVTKFTKIFDCFETVDEAVDSF